MIEEDPKKMVEDLIVAAGDVTIKWVLWKKWHDVNSLTMKCCTESINFFDSLEHLEKLIREAGITSQRKES